MYASLYLHVFVFTVSASLCVSVTMRIISHFLILQALYGVYSKDVHVRMACLNAVRCIPAVANRSLPQNIEVATSLWIALHDPEKVCPFYPWKFIRINVQGCSVCLIHRE